MILTIITINLNNAIGLSKTMHSVFNQSFLDIEYIVIDGKSNDDSLSVIHEFERIQTVLNYKWISEPDNGIYHAMNKGIALAKGEYLQFLNSGDVLADDDVINNALNYLNNSNQIVYGNMLKPIKNKLKVDRGFADRQPTMLDFYRGTLNHSPAYIKKSLFDVYGNYDESLKIVSDWKWYLNIIVFKNINIQYIDLNVTVFDMNGISNMNKKLESEERSQVLNSLLPDKIIQDYQMYSFPIEQYLRVKKKRILSCLIYIIERVIAKIESKI